MSKDKTGERLGSYEFPIAEGRRQGAHQLAESVAMFDLRPSSAAEAAMSTAIDQIHDRLARDIPKLQREMDALLIRARRPGLA